MSQKNLSQLSATKEFVKLFKNFNIHKRYYTPPKVFFTGLRMQKFIEIKSKKMFHKMSRILAFSVPQKVVCVMWSPETKSITLIQRIYCRIHQAIPPSRSSTSRWVQHFCEHGIVKVQIRSRRHSIMSEDERRISNYFNRHLSISLETAGTRLGLPKSSMH